MDDTTEQSEPNPYTKGWGLAYAILIAAGLVGAAIMVVGIVGALSDPEDWRPVALVGFFVFAICTFARLLARWRMRAAAKLEN